MIVSTINCPKLRPNRQFAIGEDNAGPTMPHSKKAAKQADAKSAPQEREPKTRNRPIKACFPCRHSKGRCDQARPRCSRCEEHSIPDCNYLPTSLSPDQLAALNELKQTDRKIQNVRTVLAVGNPPSKITQGVRKWFSAIGDSNSDGSISGTEDEGFEQSGVSAINITGHENDLSDEDPIMDMGFKFGKVVVNDRIGAYQRPTADQELDFVLKSPLFDRRTPEEKAESPEIPQVEEYYEPMPDGASYRFQPGDTYIAPISGFPFSDGPKHQSHRPTKELASILMAQYWRSVHPVARTIHKPSFERAYRLFLEGRHTPTSTQALIFAAMFSAAVSMPKDHPNIHQHHEGQTSLLEILQLATETLLGRAHLSRATKLETLQAAVTYLIPLCRGDIGRVHSTAVASAVRIAQCMGLHKDGTEMNCDAVTTHIRRMIWYELLLLDTRAYEAHGPQLLVREDSFTTKLPLNVNDDDLERERPPCEDSDTWTDMTLTRIRMECDRVIRKIYVDRDRLGSADGRIILTDVLCYIAQFRRTMMEKYVPMINDSNSLQYYAQLNIDLHTRRMHAIMLQRYHGMGGLERMPDRVNKNLKESGIATMAIAKEIETSEGLRPWLWFAGALHQHDYALLMLVELFMHPYRKGAIFTWNYLDWVFEVPPDQVNDPQKARRLLTKVRNEMRAYLTAKRLRCPNYMGMTPVAQSLERPEHLPPAIAGPTPKIGIRPGEPSNGTNNISRSHPSSFDSVANPNGTHQPLTTMQASVTILQSQSGPASVYDPSIDPMRGIEAADSRQPFDMEWKYNEIYPPEYHTGDLNNTPYEYRPPIFPVPYNEQGQFQAIASIYPGLEPSEAFSSRSQQYNNAYAYPPGTSPCEGPRIVSIETPTDLHTSFPTSESGSYPIHGTFEGPFQSNGHHISSPNSSGSNSASTNGYASAYGGEALSRSSSYTEAPAYHNYEAIDCTIGSGRQIQDVPHRPVSGRAERPWHPSGISKKRKQPSLGRVSR